MNREQWLRGVCWCLVAAVIFFAGGMILNRDTDRQEGAGQILISEVLTSNRSYPSPRGEYLDYIEIHNYSGTVTDLSGYRLSLGHGTDYVFPQGTVLSAYGYLAVWCDPAADGGNYGSFDLTGDGSEVVGLYNVENNLVDSVQVPRMADNIPFIRRSDGTWDTGTRATPGFVNTDEGFQAWLDYMNSRED